MSLSTIKAINNSLQKMDYRGTVTLAGFGEPLLQKNIIKHVQELKKGVQLKQIKLITNGDYLTPKSAKKLVKAGINCIKVSMYDEDKTEYYDSFLKEYDIERIYKHYYEGLPEDVEVNRNEMWQKSKIINKKSPCYLPFYKMFVNWNGDVALCSNDWNLSQIFGNVNRDWIHDIWESDYYKAYRRIMIKSQRIMSPCISCDVNGQVLGKESYDYYKDNA